MSLDGLGATPASRAQSQLDDLYGAGKASESPLAAFQAVSRKTRVPVNVLLALDEGRGDLKAAQSNAERLSAAVAEGKPIEAAITDLAGDEARGTAILQTAYRIADELEPPAPPAPDRGNDGKIGAGEALGGLGRDVATGAVRATGGAVEALGIAADEALRFGNDPASDGPTIARTAGRAAGDAVRGAGDAIADSRSEDYKTMRAGTQPGGDITDPSSWTLGEDPSLLGLLGVAAEGIGSMAPLVAAPNAGIAAVFGGLMGAGEGAQNGRKFVEDAAKTLDENGKPEIEKLPEYQALTKGGMDPAKAVEELSRQAENSAGFRQGLIASIGGAATNRIMRGAEGWLGQGGRLTRAVKKGSAGAVEEGAQEVAEGAASGLGIEAATGGDVDVLADSFGNFVGGALAGGGMGVGAGALGRGEEPARRPEPQPEYPPQPLGLPSPTDGGTIFAGAPQPDVPPSGPLGLPPPPERLALPAPQRTGGPVVAAPRLIAQDPTYRNPNFSFPALPSPGQELGAPPVEPGTEVVSAPRQITHNPDVHNPNWAFPSGSPGPQQAGGAVVAAPRQITHDPRVQNPNFAFPALPGPDARGSPAPSQPGTGVVPAPRLIEHNPNVQNPNWSFPTGSPASPTAGRPLGLPAPMIPAGGSGADQAAAPVLSPPSLGAGAVAPELGIAPPAPTAPPAQVAGPVEAIAQKLQASMPAPTPEPAPRFPEQKPGSAIVIGTEDGAVTNGVFMGETPNGAVVRVQGQEIELTPEQFDRARDQAEINQNREDQGDVEPAGTETGADQRIDTSGLGDGGGRSSEAVEEAGPAVQAGIPGSDLVDRQPAQEQLGNGQVDGPDLGDVDVATGAGQLGDALTEAPAAVATAAANVAPEPTDGQKEAGNYRKGHARWNGLDLSVETAKGQTRSGKGPDGTEWSVTMPANYGYFKRTEGADGDHVDFYMGDNEASDQVFVIDQVDAETGAFDEHKVMLGFNSAVEARAAHEAAFSDGKGAARLGGIAKMGAADFKDWLKNGDTKKAVSTAGRQKQKAAPAAPTAPQKRPFISYVGRSFGGINPGGKAAEELRHRGITARTAPGLFRRGGRRELDNIVADEHPELVGAIGRADDGIYLSPQAIIDAIADEVAGVPLAFGRHAEDQQAARDVRAARRAVDDDAAPIDPGTVPDRDRDISTDEERLTGIEAALDDILAQMPPSTLTAEARQTIIARINADGGDIADAVYDEIVRSERNAVREAADDGSATGEVSDIPFGNEGATEPAEPVTGTDSRTDPEGSGAGSTVEPDGNDDSSGTDESGLDQPAVEPGADGLPQTILPGMEGDEAQRQSSLTAKQRAEIEARQQQSKARRLDGNSGDAGPLFDDQQDMFSASPAPKPAEPEPVATEEPAPPAKIEDFGEKIGGARKDIAERGFERGPRAPSEGDDQPAWRRQYHVGQIAKSLRPSEEGRWQISDAKSNRPIRSGYTPMTFATKEEAEAMIPLYEVAKKHRVYGENDGTFAIYRRVTDRKRVMMQGGFPDREAADRYMAQNAVQLIETNTRIDDSIHPALEQAIRDGDARREGDGNVTPKDFTDVFGFRAVEFGNWNNAAERQHILNQAYDAFLDMAEILGIPPKAVSLNGELALAFGARGSGLSGARAHYERNYGVINLTKIQGAGALAHEWWHAFDHYLGRQDGRASRDKITNERGDAVFDAKDPSKDYASHGFLLRGSKVRPEVRAAMEKMVKAVFQRKAEFTEDVSTRERIAQRQVDDLERSMKQFRDQLATEQQWGRKRPAATPEQLAEIDQQFERIRKGDLGEKQLAPSKGVSLFMLNDPMMKIMEIYKAVRGRQGYGMSQGRMSGAIYDLQRAIDVKEQSERVLAEAKEQRVKEKTVRTEFYSEAWKLDQGRTGDYWNTNHEMTARAFESFIYDRLKDVEARNDFLSYEKHNNLPQYRLFNVKPYPEGQERLDMNAAFEELFATFQTRETDQGVELFQRDMSEPVATLTGDELGAWEDIRQLGKKAEAWYRSNLVGREPVANVETGWKIQFDATGARKTGGRKGDILYRLVPAIPAIIENGRLISSEPDNRGREEIRAVHKLSARVSMGGREYSVIAAIREKADGTYHYDLSMDRGASGFSTATVQEQRSRTSALEGDSAALNLDIAGESVNGDAGEALTPAQARAVNATARAELEKVGIAGQVAAQAGGNGTANASYRRGVISILRPGGNWKHALDHEIIHALRDPALWNRSHGLFEADEWRALVRAARADKAIRSRVEAAYGDLDAAGQSEEMVAELYADWAQGRRDAPAGPLQAALDRIQSFFRAVASALRGEGFQDAARIMERIASGEIGGRGPDGPGGAGKGETKELRGTATKAFREWFGDSKVVDGSGKPRIMFHGSETDAIEVFEGLEVTGWFASDRATAETYDSGGGIHEVYLSVQNPLHLPFDMNDMRTPRQVLDEAGFPTDTWYQPVLDQMGMAYDAVNTAAFVGLARNAGFDGIRVKERGRETWAVFDPTQIKSVDNNGNWNPADPRIKEQRDMTAFAERFNLSNPVHRARGMIGNMHWRKAPQLFSDMLTDAMGKSAQINSLALVPGRALFSELGKGLKAAQSYLHEKEAMDAERNDWHGRGDVLARKWWKLRVKDSASNDALMGLMHRSTLSGIDPSKPDDWEHPQQDRMEALSKSGDPAARALADKIRAEIEGRQKSHAKLKAEYDALPEPFQALYREVRDEYTALADAMDAALVENMKTAAEIALKRAQRAHRKELQRIKDEGLTGPERDQATTEADAALDAAERRARVGAGARMAALRKQFESNRLSGPYFPLARFGTYFVTIRDDQGKVISFSRFEKKSQQDAFVRDAEASGQGKVERGVLNGDANLKDMVDPRFVADVEGLLQDAGAGAEVMDAVWQHWLETLPDQSIRTNQIHRKGRAGFNTDAFRAFGKQMFHGSHQLARLKHGLKMEEILNDAEEEAARSAEPERAGFVVQEMRRRHQFTMNPTGNPATSTLTSIGFIWYLGMSPAAALVNISQTTLIGVPMMAHQFKRGGVPGAVREVTRAMRDFADGRGWSEKSDRLTDDEKAAMQTAYRLGTIDKSQAHDLASVADSGVEYNPLRQAVMEKIGWMFHHTERLNREVTFLANYRMARDEGMDQDAAVRAAADLTWKIHFDYQNSNRPRFMQGDVAKVILLFRSYTVNLLWRLFRDAHQTFHGRSKEERAEAKAQLVGITLSMFAHAGIRGVWGYGILMCLLGIFFPGGDDDAEKWLENALLMEGDDAGTAAWNWTMGLALNGAPGHLTNIDLTSRIGSPNLWFRDSGRDLEGSDAWNQMVNDMLGPVFGIGAGIARGAGMASRDPWRAVETAMPKFLRDGMQSYRFATEGAVTLNGDPLIEDMKPQEVLSKIAGFTPARLSERYRLNNRLKNEEKRVMDERKGLHREAGRAIRGGEPIPDDLRDKIEDFNLRYPFYPITAASIRQSVTGQVQSSERNEGGVSLNPKLDRVIREGQAPTIY